MLKKILLGLIFTYALSFGLSENMISKEMELKIDSVTTLLQDKTITKEEKTKKLFVIMDDVFDFELMAQISLGRAYKTITDKQREEYISLFVKRVKNSYLDKIDLYTNEKILVKDLEKVKSNRITLLTHIIGKDAVYEIIYKFYSKNNDWLIYDVDILGVSIVQTYRKQFSEFLATKSFDELLNTLK